MKHTNKKGFTIVELVVVIAVVAVLAAVLIPTFAGLIDSANKSADQQAVTQLNTILASAAADKPTSLAEVEELFAENGYTLKGYTPLASGHKFVWSKAENSIMIVDKNDKVVYPAKYAGKTMANTSVLSAADNFTVVANASELANAVEKGGVVKLPTNLADLESNQPALNITEDTTVELNGATLSIPNDETGDGVFFVKNGATLTLNGEGVVNGAANEGKNNYNLALYVKDGYVVINSGTYTNEDVAGADPDNTDKCYSVILVNGGNVVINGGTFKGCTPAWTINLQDGSNSRVEVRGGEFYEFDPSAQTNNDGKSFVPTGYESVAETRADGTWYVVRPIAD